MAWAEVTCTGLIDPRISIGGTSYINLYRNPADRPLVRLGTCLVRQSSAAGRTLLSECLSRRACTVTFNAASAPTGLIPEDARVMSTRNTTGSRGPFDDFVLPKQYQQYPHRLENRWPESLRWVSRG
jgi:hypothetical protein